MRIRNSSEFLDRGGVLYSRDQCVQSIAQATCESEEASRHQQYDDTDRAIVVFGEVLRRRVRIPSCDRAERVHEVHSEGPSDDRVRMAQHRHRTGVLILRLHFTKRHLL